MKHSPEKSEQNSKLSFMRRHKGKMLLAAAGASIALPLSSGHGDEMLNEAKDIAPWVLPGMAVAEAAWIGGAVLCVGSAGKNLKFVARHPLQARHQFGSMVREACDTTAFKAGLAINTAGAIAEFIIPVSAVVTHMPVEAWGVTAPAFADLAATVALRGAIYNTIKHKEESGAVVEPPLPQQPELLPD